MIFIFRIWLKNLMDLGLIIRIEVGDGAIQLHRFPTFSDYCKRFHMPIVDSLPPNIYLMHVGYAKGDMQLGVTGSCKLNESYKQAAVREVWEEMGISFKKWCYMKSFSGNGRPHIYMVNADDYFIPTDVVPITGVDDRKRKISVMIVGTYDKLTEIMSIAKPYDPSENITYYSAVSVSLLKKEYGKN